MFNCRKMNEKLCSKNFNKALYNLKIICYNVMCINEDPKLNVTCVSVNSGVINDLRRFCYDV